MATVISGDTGVSQVQDGVIQTADIAALAVTPEKMSQKLTLATAQNTTSGTAINFTSIPSWVKQITLLLNGVSTNGASNPLIQIGSGSPTTSGYVGVGSYIQHNSSSGAAAYTTGFGLFASTANNAITGSVILINISGNTWVASGNAFTVPNVPLFTSGSVTLSSTLDRLRITTVNGTDTFDAGSVNIMYEG